MDEISKPAAADLPLVEPIGSQAAGPDDVEADGPASAPSAADGTSFVPVRAMEDIMAARHEQIFTHGHTPEGDLLLTLDHFGKELRRRILEITEGVSCNQSRDVIRRRLVKLGAFTMAMIDRIDGEQAERNGA